MLPVLNKRWSHAFRHKDTEDAIVACLGIDVVPKLFLHPSRLMMAMLMEKKREITFELHSIEPQRSGVLTFKLAAETDDTGHRSYSCYCKVDLGQETLHEVTTDRIADEPNLLDMMRGVRAVFVRHGLKMT